ncbi:MAG TPA: 3-phosphoshikimate 1-carboxyvinyltransferase [Planctomycetota bacterium]|mgnify:FL=1|nr:3-phosphoshikimate 1-carboxyvinyltransferase [Planctomycetota bacterium]
MSDWKIEPHQWKMQGEIYISPDKSITHRALLLASLVDGISYIHNPLMAGDTKSTLQTLQQLGIQIEKISDNTLRVKGNTFQKPTKILNLGNTGTGIRLLSGILAGLPFKTSINSSEQMRKRPMKRILNPLRAMGAKIQTKQNDQLPWIFQPSVLHAIEYTMPIASAQVKSCLLLASLFTKETMKIIEQIPTRDHTERMLQLMGAKIWKENHCIQLIPSSLQPLHITIPNDFSSAAFFIVAALLLPNSNIILRNINFNPTRIGLYHALLAMGANIKILQLQTKYNEPIADLQIQTSTLCSISIQGSQVVDMIDEFPIFMIAASQAHGVTTVHDAQELRYKETDRIATMIQELQKMNIFVQEYEDGFRIHGPQTPQASQVYSHNDHRVAMSLIILAMLASKPSIIKDASAIYDSLHSLSFNKNLSLNENLSSNSDVS